MRVTLALIVECCLSLPSWLRWMKLFEIEWDWSLSLITFSMSLSIVLRRIMGLKDLEDSYDSLLDLDMIIEVDVLKCDG